MSWTIAAVFVVAALLLILPTERFSIDDTRIRTAAILIVVAAAVVIGGAFGPARDRDVRRAGHLTNAEVIELTEEKRRWKGEMITVWVARVRYRDASGEVHEGIIDDCNEADSVRLQPGMSTTIRYDERRPKSFTWTPDEG